QFETGADGCERITQLMSQQGEKLIFAAVRFPECGFRTLAVAHIDDGSDPASDSPLFVTFRSIVHVHPSPSCSRLGEFDLELDRLALQDSLSERPNFRKGFLTHDVWYQLADHVVRRAPEQCCGGPVGE